MQNVDEALMWCFIRPSALNVPLLALYGLRRSQGADWGLLSAAPIEPHSPDLLL